MGDRPRRRTAGIDICLDAGGQEQVFLSDVAFQFRLEHL